MTKISIYPTVVPTGTDKVIGTDTTSSDATKNFTIQAIADFAATSGSGIIGYTAVVTSAATSAPVASDYVFIGAATHVCTLPTAVGVSGRTIGTVLTVAPAGPATVTVVPTGAETINGAASQAFTAQYAEYVFVSDGTNWFLSSGGIIPLPLSQGGTGTDLSAAAGAVSISGGVTSVGTLALTQGGTGAATAADAIVAMNGYNYTATVAGTSSPTYGDILSIDVATHTATLPTAVGYAGRTIMMQLTVTAVSVTVDTTGAETINGAATLTINKDDTQYLFLSNGANWRYLGT